MAQFDDFMKWLVKIPPDEIDNKQRQILAEKRGKRSR
jgi:hypothetical protein